MKTLPLNEDTKIPVLGFGTWQLEGDICFKAVEKALEVGYRYIDTADAYGNHKEIAQAIKKSSVPRNELFITTKLWHSNLSEGQIPADVSRFLDELQTDYIDLLLIHWPNKTIPISETLQAMNSIKEKGIVKALGVSNFTIHHLQDALDCGIEISNNQVELHPSFSQPELKKFCDEHKIVLTAYSPIAQGEDLKIETIQTIAQKYNRSPSQVILNWIIQKGMVAIPRSSKPEHIEDNFKALEWKLTNEEIKEIDTLDNDNRIINPGFSEFNY